MNNSLRLPVTDPPGAGEARRRAASWAKERAFDPELSANIALVVTELATNLAIHTVGGEILLRQIFAQEQRGVEILSLDKGPGVANFAECLRDGFSTAGTAGNGLGAIRRASHLFEVHSQPGVGTAILSELWARPPAKENGGWQEGAANVALEGEEACGDSWAIAAVRPGVLRVIMADGLGHGEFAAMASRKAVEVFLKGVNLPLLDLMETMHQALRSTRGAAVAVAELNAAAGQVAYAGVGNTAAAILTGEKTTRLVSHNGTIGVQYRRAQELVYPWARGSTLVLHTDGLKTDWHLDGYLGLAGRRAALIAGALYRDFRRTNDDATIVVLKERT